MAGLDPAILAAVRLIKACNNPNRLKLFAALTALRDQVEPSLGA
jgi:hypothetical protein